MIEFNAPEVNVHTTDEKLYWENKLRIYEQRVRVCKEHLGYPIDEKPKAPSCWFCKLKRFLKELFDGKPSL